MFVDDAIIYVRSGDGGNGVVHFLQEKYRAKGGPDGGDGGRGANVILQVDRHLNTLTPFRFQKEFVGDNGKNGAKQNMTGRSAKDLIIKIPAGTIVYDADTGDVLGDMVEEDQILLVCKGGRGGRGNQHFANSRNQAPRIAEKGEPGEERNLRLELKLIADVGIVGVPNAGKSSFLAAVTNAKPKIADYPFTTLEPNLGVAELDLDHVLVLADIPGLIEGAHMGVGLGDSFLRHIQRTRVLIHMLDGLGEDPLLDLSQINSELALFDEELAEKPQVVVVTKQDLPDAQAMWELIEPELRKRGYDPMAISSATHQNLRPLLWRVNELLESLPEPEPVVEMPVYRAEEDPRAFTIEEEEDGFRVAGKSIERAAAMTYWEHPGSARRFQRILELIGIDQALRDAGAENGDTIYIGEFVLEWRD
ncbi:MAG: GTPase ObgE [Anaerolineaceae bacterium]|nr:GTPase ObgE [Anaerolineaceae bacterium]